MAKAKSAPAVRDERAVVLADLEHRLRADGVQIVEPEPVDLRALYESIKKTRELRQQYAARAAADAALVASGQRLGKELGEIVLTFPFVRDKRGNLLSAELEFVSIASAFHGASDDEIAEVLSPWAYVAIATPAQRKTALASVRKAREKLRRLHVVV